jgi:hypothetical protein
MFFPLKQGVMAGLASVFQCCKVGRGAQKIKFCALENK